MEFNEYCNDSQFFYVWSYFFSKFNRKRFNSSRKPIIININSGSYLNVCLHGDGNLPEEFGLYSQDYALFEFDELNNIINIIGEAKSDLLQEETVINEFKDKIEDTKIYKGVEIFDLNESVWMNLEDMINNYNGLILNEVNDQWTLGDTCSDETYELLP